MRFLTPLPRIQAGFTLLEVMVAVSIIAMSFVSLLGSQSQSISIADISRFETTAAMLAREKLSELQLAGFSELTDGSGQFEDDFADYAWQSEVQDLGESETGIANSDGMLKLVTLKISRGDDPNQTFSVRSVIMTEIEPAEEVAAYWRSDTKSRVLTADEIDDDLRRRIIEKLTPLLKQKFSTLHSEPELVVKE